MTEWGAGGEAGDWEAVAGYYGMLPASATH
jgi:hypothetical protein